MLVKTILNLQLLLSSVLFSGVSGKYVQGTLKSKENWVFLARFCFLSDEGQFEYVINYNENQGDLNLLLYYDTEDQWPAVYKSDKTCEEREQVLNIQQNQIVNLTARTQRMSDFSGCKYSSVPPTTPRPLYTIKIPTLKATSTTPRTKKITTRRGTVKITTPSSIRSTTPSILTTTSSSITTGKHSFTEKETTAELKTTFYTPEITTNSFTTSTNQLYTTTSIREKDITISIDKDEVTRTSIGSLDVDSNFLTTVEPIHGNVKILSTLEPFLPQSSQKAPIKKRSVPTKPSPYLRRLGRMVNCHNARRFRSARERWWFIAISNCNGTQGISLDYQLLMTNGPPGDYWHEHFSADEFYILPLLMAFSIAYSFLMLGIVVCSIELKSRQLLHTTYKIFVVSCVFQLFGIVVLSLVYLKYATTGIEAPKVKRFGNMLLGASETCCLLLLLLIGKGFTVTRGRLPVKASIKLTVFMCVYIVTYLSIFIYEALVFDPGEVLYLYESPAGYSLMLLRICAWFMFIYSTVMTLKKYPEKSNFYYPFNLLGTVWFVAGPAFIISANTYIDKWIRESIVCAVLLLIAFGGHLMFLILTMPSVANKNFPYHVRTTQIGIMEVNGGATSNGTGNIEQFGHHAYEPSLIREQTVIIPLTRRTEEIFEGMYHQRAFDRNAYDSQEMTDANLENDIPHVIEPDGSLENVLNWSKARNLPPIDFPTFERVVKRDSIGSVGSKLSNSFRNGSSVLSRRPSLTNQLTADNQDAPGNLDSTYVKDVPVELFTVSKSVASRMSKNGDLTRHE